MRRTTVVLTVLAMVLGVMAVPAVAQSAKNTAVSGVGTPGGPGDFGCVANPLGAPDYVILMEGDLDGCIYGYGVLYEEKPNGIVNARDREIFVGDVFGNTGTFEMREHFTAKFNDDGSQKFGRCQHPIVSGTGTGDLEGIAGRLDFKDDVVNLVADYRGHVKLPNA